MMLLTIMLNERKNIAAIPEPHVSPEMQSGSRRPQSYMILFQSSPVEMENNNEKL